MPPMIRPHFSYHDPTLTPPEPGNDLVLEVTRCASAARVPSPPTPSTPRPLTVDSSGAPDVVVLAGRDCTRIVTAVWPHARTPLAGSRSMGEQLQRLAAIAVGGSLDHIGLHQKSA
jgi:hypothetical protein